MKKIAILQSNYIPWKGYFDLIASVDEFILYDDMQFTKNDWRNRNKIKTPKGLEWISIPVGANIDRKIRDVRLPAIGWSIKHLKTIKLNYAKSKYFDVIFPKLEQLYALSESMSLSEFNRSLIEFVCITLGINTKISNSWDYQVEGDKTERLVKMCLQAKANIYVSGPSAQAYIDKNLFDREQIELKWFDYSGYPEYPQLWGDFQHGVTVLDLLFNCGSDSHQYMKFKAYGA